MGDAPISDMFEFASVACGLDVMSLDAPASEHGASMTDTGTGRTAIAVSTSDNPMRQRSSIAHELGHVLFNHLSDDSSPAIGERSDEEKLADTFARHLLLPLDVLRHSSAERMPRLEDLSKVVQEYGVSPHIAAIQFREAGIIDDETCKGWSKFSTRKLAGLNGWLQHYEQMSQASAQPRAPQNLVRRAVLGYRAGLLTAAELALWYGRTAEELEELFGPPEVDADVDLEVSDDFGDAEFWESFGADA